MLPHTIIFCFTDTQALVTNNSKPYLQNFSKKERCFQTHCPDKCNSKEQPFSSLFSERWEEETISTFEESLSTKYSLSKPQVTLCFGELLLCRLRQDNCRAATKQILKVSGWLEHDSMKQRIGAAIACPWTSP